MNCTRCGTFLPYFDERDDRVDADLCDECSNNFFEAMAQEYPFGQCPQCGARYQQFTCELGKTHTEAFHAEGACSMWRDPGEPPGPEGVAAGFCSYGCHPSVSATEVWTAPYFPTGEDAPPERWDDEMPF